MIKKFIALFAFIFFLATFQANATISTEQSQVILQGNGVTTVFSFPFVADSVDNIQVSYTPSGGVPQVLLPSQYSIFLNPPSTGQLWGVGGTVQYPISGSPIAAGSSLTIQRTLPLQQLVTIANQGNFNPEVIEQGIDILEMQSQQISARTGAFRGVWQTGVVYNFGDIVQDGANGDGSGNYYMCILANTSSTWNADLAAGDWTLIITSAFPTTPLPLSIANGGTGATTAPAALAALGAISLSGANVYTGSNNFTGSAITVPNRSGGDSTQNAANTAFVTGALSGKAPLANPSFTGTVTAPIITPTTGITGVTNGSNAGAGYVGEYVSAEVPVGSAVGLTSNVTTNITSISLTAGDWDVYSTAYFRGDVGTTVTNSIAGISTVSGLFPSSLDAQSLFSGNNEALYAGGNVYTLGVGPTRVSITGTTTVYLVAQSGFGGGNSSVYGVLKARRIR